MDQVNIPDKNHQWQYADDLPRRSWR